MMERGRGVASSLESSKDLESFCNQLSLVAWFVLFTPRMYCIERVFDDEEWFRSIFSASTKREAVQNQVSGQPGLFHFARRASSGEQKRGGLFQMFAVCFADVAKAPSSTIDSS